MCRQTGRRKEWSYLSLESPAFGSCWFIQPANLSAGYFLTAELRTAWWTLRCLQYSPPSTRCYKTPELISNMFTGSLLWDLLTLFYLFSYVPAPFLGHASRNAVATGGEKGKDNVQQLCEWNEQLPNLTWWAHRGARKARGQAGERDGTWQTASCGSQDWQLEQPMDNRQDGITSGIFFFYPLFNLHYTKHGGHIFFLSEARFYLERFFLIVRTPRPSLKHGLHNSSNDFTKKLIKTVHAQLC